MKIVIARHATAEDKATSTRDSDRVLTEEGRKQADQMGRLLAATLGPVDPLWTSPLARALETAEIAGKHLKVEPSVEPLLIFGGDLEHLCWQMQQSGAAALMVVGHQPDLGKLAARLLGLRSDLSLKKAGICIVETQDPTGPKGRAIATLDPRQFADILEGREYVPWMRTRQIVQHPEES